MTRIYKSIPLRLRLVIILGIISVLMASTVLIALADSSPVLGDFTPAPNTEITGTEAFWLKVSFTASDADEIDDSSVQVKFNGTSVHPSLLKIEYEEIGHWEQVWNDWDGRWETVWVSDGYDYTKATIKAQFWVDPNVLPDRNTVWVSVADKLGNTSTDQWNLNRNVSPVIDSLSPANGAKAQSAILLVSARVTDNGTIDVNSIVIEIDTSTVRPNFDSTTGVVSGMPPAPLAAGRHDVYLAVKDTSGNTSSVSWYFDVPEGTASFASAIPEPNSTIDTWNPDISVAVSDVAGLDKNSAVMLINGEKVSAVATIDSQDASKGKITYRPDMLDDETCTVAVSITNINGVPSSYTWSFGVKAPPKIGEAYPADTIVSTATPTISAKITENGSGISSVNMSLNGDDVAASFNPENNTVSYTPTAPLANDVDHTVKLTVVDGVGASASQTWKFSVQTLPDMPIAGECVDCHQGYPAPNHPMDNCQGCHGGGAPINDCRDCHGIQKHSPDRLTQVEGHWYWEPGCDWCHNSTYSYKIPVHPEDNAGYHNTTTSMDMCKSCHTPSLTREHYRHTDDNGEKYNCDTCHASTRAEVQSAIADKRKDCGACHNAGHEAQHDTAVLDEKCTTCHKNNLVQEHLSNTTTQDKALTCDSCHSSSDPAVSVAITNGSKHCASCHSTGHNMNFVESVPSDIPLYSGFKWSTPLDAGLWAGESWVPAEFNVGGKVLISNRRTGLTGDDVWDFYRTEMSANGWSLVSDAPATGSNFYSVTFTKGDRKAVIWFYGGEDHKASSPVLDSGYRVEILYR